MPYGTRPRYPTLATVVALYNVARPTGLASLEKEERGNDEEKVGTLAGRSRVAVDARWPAKRRGSARYAGGELDRRARGAGTGRPQWPRRGRGQGVQSEGVLHAQGPAHKARNGGPHPRRSPG